MRIALAQIAPVLLDRDKTVARAVAAVREAAANGARLVTCGESFVPAYPLWLCRQDAARFNEPEVKEVHAAYLDQAVRLEDGHLDPIRDAAKASGVHVVLGIAERPRDRGGNTIYCSAVVVNDTGEVAGVHRKLMPTYEERLAWGPGDGHGLRVHRVGPFTMSVLNCWENWMPLARASLYAQGADLHVAIWPGCKRLTEDITRFVALEGRCYVASASAIIRPQDVPNSVPHRDHWAGTGVVDGAYYDGGSCVAGPDGAWLVPPMVGCEGLIYADLDPAIVRAERQNFDPSGHYARPDVLDLAVDRTRQGVRFTDDRAAHP